MDELLSLVEKANEEYQKFQGGNKSAGTRCRVALQKIKVEAQNIRKEIQNQKNSG